MCEVNNIDVRNGPLDMILVFLIFFMRGCSLKEGLEKCNLI